MTVSGWVSLIAAGVAACVLFWLMRHGSKEFYPGERKR